ncbi:MAG: S8 family serine peptidase [candidate division WOR-3 bacterium]
MKRLVLVLGVLLVAAGYGVVTPDLERHLAVAEAGQRLPVHVVLRQQFDTRLLNSLVDGLPKVERRVAVARILGEYSREQQAGILEYLSSQVATGAVVDVRSLWIVNAVYCEATPEVIRELAARGDVDYVNYDLAYSPDLLEPDQGLGESEDEIAWGVQKVNAPAVWALGYTGAGIVCGHIDTGCNYNHPDLADHMWTDPNYPNHGWNFENNNNDPNDAQGHGTHTAGSVASDGTAGSQCGVAPDAQIMVCRVRTVADSVAESQCWQAMQFVVSPPLSPSNGADLYTMSLGWQISWNPHQATWRTVANNVNAAGLSQIVAAGNERGISPPNACRCPGNVPPPWWNPQNTGTGALSGIVSIGATDVNDVIANFSSPGPVTWATVSPFNDYAYPPGLTRPDVSAPGVDVKSCSRTGGYTLMSGTSMATPHTAGVVCLMLSKNPNLSPAAIDSILELTAVDLGPNGKDNDYGAGRIDALAAVNYITGAGGPNLIHVSTAVIDSSGNNNGRVDPGETARLQMTLRNTGGSSCNNTAGVLRSGDARLTVTDANGFWGNIASGASATNTGDRFEVQASSQIPNGTSIPCTLHVTGDSAWYAKTFVFNLVVGVPPVPGQLLMNHDTGYCRLTVSCQGSIGYDLPPADAGAGFCYPKSSASALFYSAFAMGNSASYVADRFYSQPASGNPNADLRPVDSLRPVVPPQAGDQHYRGSYSDAGHTAPKSLLVTQNSYQVAASGYDDFVVLVFDIANNGSSAVNDMYAGVFADFDIGSSSTSNTLTSDTVRRFTYMRQSSTANPTVGVKILSPQSFANLSGVDHARYVYPDSCVTDNQKFRFLNGTIRQRNSDRAYDWSVLTSVGPFNLQVGGVYRFAVAFVGGADENAARANADSAQSWFDNNVGIAEGPGRPRGVEKTLAVVPNPFAGRAGIRYQTPVAGRARITAVDVTGRTVAVLLDAEVAAGAGEVTWRTHGLASGVYFIKLETPGGKATERALLVR